jgi:hypothetical protein
MNKRPTAGSAQLCSRSYGNVTFVGAHDSYAVGASDCECPALQSGHLNGDTTPRSQWLQTRTTMVSPIPECLLVEGKANVMPSDTAVEGWRPITPSASTTTVRRYPLVPHKLRGCLSPLTPSSISHNQTLAPKRRRPGCQLPEASQDMGGLEP